MKYIHPKHLLSLFWLHQVYKLADVIIGAQQIGNTSTLVTATENSNVLWSIIIDISSFQDVYNYCNTTVN